ncbi:MAG: O-antigen ligase family protein [Candidatus Ancaeobacter aquaticus]|nr:O-antigen ligase family protein [Candidatus Ancaeobacter aquaticus]
MSRDTVISLISAIIDSVIAFLILFAPFAFGSVEPWAYRIIEVSAVILFVLWIVKICVGGKEFFRVRFPLISIPVILLIGFTVFQLFPLQKTTVKKLSPKTYELYATNIPRYEPAYYLKNLDKKDYRFRFLQKKPYNTFLYEAVGNDERPLSVYTPSTKKYLWKIISLFLIFFVAVNNITTKEQVRRILVVIITAGFILALVGILQKLTFNGKLLWFRIPRYGGDPFGPYVNKNNFANYIVMIIPVAIGYILTQIIYRFRRVQGDTLFLRMKNIVVSDFLYRILLMIFVVSVMITALIMSKSLLGVISGLYGLLFFMAYIFIKNKKVLLSLIIGLVLFVPMLFIASGGEVSVSQMYKKYSGPSISEQIRVQYYVDGYEMIKDYPYTGTGLGTFSMVFPQYKSVNLGVRTRFLHNDFMQLCIEVGVVCGAIVILSVLFFLVYTVLRLVFLKKKRSFYYSMFGVAVGMFCMLIHALGGFHFHIPANALLFTVLGALLWSMGDIEKNESGKSRKYKRIQKKNM